MKQKFHFLKLAKIHRDAIRSMSIYNHQTGNGNGDSTPMMITVSRDSEAHVFPILSSGLVDLSKPEYTFFLSTQISTVCVLDHIGHNQEIDVNSLLPECIFIFGCLNGHLYVFSGFDQNATQCLMDHQNNVCIVRSNLNKTLIASGSWDHTCLVYQVDIQPNDGKILKKLFQITSHTESVMDVMFVHANHLLTASSDRTIGLWDFDSTLTGSGQCIQLQTFTGHEDCVRGLLLKKSDSNNSVQGFYSISNDQTIRYWNLVSGLCEKIFIGHEHFIFDICYLSSDYFITCGENNSVMIWHHLQETPPSWQSLKLPTVTIWSVISPNDQMFYAAGSDGYLYIFTNRQNLDPTREMIQLYDEMMVKQTKIPWNSVAHLKKIYEENSLRTIPATKHGDRRLIRSMEEDDTILVYEWNAQQEIWKPIGHVSDYQKGQLDEPIVDQITGRVPYNDDYYDEVFNVKLNDRTYKLPFNRDQNPWHVAQNFIEQNQLDYGALTSLVQCIVNYANYKPKQPKGDVFHVTLFYYPLYEFHLWPQLPSNMESFRKKFQQLNISEEIPESIRLPSEHLNVSTEQLEKPGDYCEEFLLAFQKLFKWPSKHKFIVHDLLRLLLVNKYFNTYFVNRLTDQNDVQEQDQTWFRSIILSGPYEEMAGQLTTLRVLANMFSSVHGAQYMFENFQFVNSSIIKWNELCPNLNVHLAYASIWFNYSILLSDWKKCNNLQFKKCLIKILIDHSQLLTSTDICTKVDNYDRVLLELMDIFGNLLASKYHQNQHSSNESETYLEHLKQFVLEKFKNKQNYSELQYRFRQVMAIYQQKED